MSAGGPAAENALFSGVLGGRIIKTC